jgi:YebC/PmpR family DNA-binding regulatory protein
MSGHSKWATIKHKKGAADARRGRVFTRITREITMAARLSGGDPDGNPRLRKAIEEAKAVNMPSDNIKRAIQRGTGELPGVSYEEVTYEGYGPGGVALIIEAVTDNRNRTTSEIRHLFSKHGGNLGENGSVRFLFDKKAYFAVEKSAMPEEKLMEIALEAGADDFSSDDSDVYEIFAASENFDVVRGVLEARNVPIAASELAMIPTTPTAVDDARAAQIVKLVEAFDEHDDVQHVWTNADLTASQVASDS